jgi:hypothetical protein
MRTMQIAPPTGVQSAEMVFVDKYPAGSRLLCFTYDRT